MRSTFSLIAAALLATACGGGSNGSLGSGGPGGASNDGSASESGSSDASAGSGDGSAPVDGSMGDGGPTGDASTPLGPAVAYVSGYAPNIDVFSFDMSNGVLAPTSSLASFGASPSFLAVNRRGTNLYALDENTPGRVGAYAVDIYGATGALTFLNDVSSQGDGPAFLSVDSTGKFVLVANYGDGSIAVLPVQANGGVGDAVAMQAVGANAHMILADPSNSYVFVPCLGADYVAQFLFDDTTGMLTPNAVATLALPAGSGPRHLAFNPLLPYAYLISETASTMTTLAFDGATGRLSVIQTQSTIPMGSTATNTAAEVWVHPSGRFVYGSNRGDDSIVVFSVDFSTGELTFVSRTPSGGMTPRDFTLDPIGSFLYVANQNSSNVVPFRIDPTAGTLTAAGAPLTATSASFIGIVRLPAP